MSTQDKKASIVRNLLHYEIFGITEKGLFTKVVIVHFCSSQSHFKELMRFQYGGHFVRSTKHFRTTQDFG